MITAERVFGVEQFINDFEDHLSIEQLQAAEELIKHYWKLVDALTSEVEKDVAEAN